LLGDSDGRLEVDAVEGVDGGGAVAVGVGEDGDGSRIGDGSGDVRNTPVPPPGIVILK